MKQSKFIIGEICLYRAGFGRIKREHIVRVVYDSGKGIYRVRKLGYPTEDKRGEGILNPEIIWAVESCLHKLD